MKIEIKNIKINQAFSQETICFTADIFVNGIKTGYARNDGMGGCTDYNRYEGKMDLLKQAEAYAETLPSEFYEMGGVKHEIKSNLEHFIDNAIDEAMNAKERAKAQKKIEKLQEANIVYGIPNSNNIAYIGFKANLKLIDLVKMPKGREAVEKLYNRIKGELGEGEVIFNTNLKELGL